MREALRRFFDGDVWHSFRTSPMAIGAAVIAALCIEEGLVPGCLGAAAIDPEFRSAIARDNRQVPGLRRVLSNSFGFGGSNCALVIGRAA